MSILALQTAVRSYYVAHLQLYRGLFFVINRQNSLEFGFASILRERIIDVVDGAHLISEEAIGFLLLYTESIRFNTELFEVIFFFLVFLTFFRVFMSLILLLIMVGSLQIFLHTVVVYLTEYDIGR